MCICSMPLLLVFEPIAVVDVSICMHELSDSMSEVILPLALVLGTIREYTHPITVLLITFHLSCVGVSIAFRQIFNKTYLLHLILRL